MNVFKKAELIAADILGIPKDMKLPYFLSCSISGPDAGARSVVLGFEQHRLKIPIARTSKSVFSLVEDENGYKIQKYNENYIESIELIPCRFHAPNQAFIDLHEGCVFNCAFCAAPMLRRNGSRTIIDNVLDKIIEAGKAQQINSVALTSGVGKNPSDIIKGMAAIVTRLKKELSLPVGVEPYIKNRDEIEALYSAGADEIKLNIHSLDRELFKKVCPQWDYDKILNMVEVACETFGKGKVTSNIIFGLGENDTDIYEGIDKLASMGCVPTLRKLRINKYNERNLTESLGKVHPIEAKRIISLAEGHRKIIERHRLNTLDFKTMCHACGCCDIVPFQDL